jgi:hypothetical protein
MLKDWECVMPVVAAQGKWPEGVRTQVYTRYPLSKQRKTPKFNRQLAKTLLFCGDRIDFLNSWAEAFLSLFLACIQ